MATKIAKTGITRERGWLYYLDKNGDVSRTKMARGGGRPRARRGRASDGCAPRHGFPIRALARRRRC